jgi:hypothetical protein
MKKKVVWVSSLIVVVGALFFFLKNAQGPNELNSFDEKKEDKSVPPYFKVSSSESQTKTSQAARESISKDQRSVVKEGDLSSVQKKRRAILKASKLDQFKSQVLGGIQNALKGQKKLRDEKLEKFAEAISNYPMELEFEKLLENYSEAELDYILGNLNHPAQERMRTAQQTNQKELMAVTTSQSPYQQDPQKEALVNQIFEDTNMIESTMAISDAVVGPVLMATYKQKNPKANLQEMEAYAQKMLKDQAPQTQRVMENVLLWSFNQVDQATLEDLAQYVSSHSDQGIDDKFLVDLKKLYNKFGKYIGKELRHLQ